MGWGRRPARVLTGRTLEDP
ncbi:hypothetical protein Legendre_0014, partial [Mycobacterium phage Legendre]